MCKQRKQKQRSVRIGICVCFFSLRDVSWMHWFRGWCTRTERKGEGERECECKKRRKRKRERGEEQ